MNPADVPEGPLLVDTDVVSYWTAGGALGSRFSALVTGHELAVSFATYGELLAKRLQEQVGTGPDTSLAVTPAPLCGRAIR